MTKKTNPIKGIIAIYMCRQNVYFDILLAKKPNKPQYGAKCYLKTNCNDMQISEINMKY